MSDDKKARIRVLNDLFRKTSQGGQILMTHGVSNFNHETIGRIAEAVKTMMTSLLTMIHMASMILVHSKSMDTNCFGKSITMHWI